MRRLGLVVTLWLAAPPAAGQPSLRLQPPAPGIGEAAVLELSRTPADSTQWPTGHGVVLRRLDERRFEVLPVRVGELWLAAFGDTLRWTVAGAIEQAAPERLRPLHGQEQIGPNWWPTALALALLLGPPLWWLWRRWRQRGRRPAFALPAEPPQELALRELARIEASDWLQRGEIERWFVEASRVLRAYVGGRYRVAALDATTAETLERLAAFGYRDGEVAQLEPLLARADSVKFAGARPSEHAATVWLQEIRSFVQATAVPIVYSTPEALRAAERFV
jgi:hypothetical protein